MLAARDRAALLDYAKQHGPHWKEHLRGDWYNARAIGERGAILHGLRNSPSFGHGGLEAFALQPEDMPLGTLVRVRFGVSSQVAKVEGFTRTGKIKVRGFNASRNRFYDNLRMLALCDVLCPH